MVDRGDRSYIAPVHNQRQGISLSRRLLRCFLRVYLCRKYFEMGLANDAATLEMGPGNDAANLAMGLANDAANLAMGLANDAARLRTASVSQDPRKCLRTASVRQDPRKCLLLRSQQTRMVVPIFVKGKNGGE